MCPLLLKYGEEGGGGQVRLAGEAANRLALRQRAKRHLEDQELLRTCPFRPQAMREGEKEREREKRR